MRVRRQGVALGAEELLEPGGAQPPPRLCRRVRGRDQHLLELPQGDRLLLLVPRHRVGLAGELALELLGGDHQREPVGVEAGGLGTLQLAERFAIVV